MRSIKSYKIAIEDAAAYNLPAYGGESRSGWEWYQEVRCWAEHPESPLLLWIQRGSGERGYLPIWIDRIYIGNYKSGKRILLDSVIGESTKTVQVINLNTGHVSTGSHWILAGRENYLEFSNPHFEEGCVKVDRSGDKKIVTALSYPIPKKILPQERAKSA